MTYRHLIVALLATAAILVGCAGPSPSSTPMLPNGTVQTGRGGDADWEVTIQTVNASYRAGEPIDVAAALRYGGALAKATAWGSGSGPISFGIKRIDGTIDIGGAQTDDCRPSDWPRGVAVPIRFAKSGGWIPEDPNAAFYKAYFAEPQLRLPAGTWQLTAAADFWTGGTCGAEAHRFAAIVTIQVLPAPLATQ
jgi:hypothetical protein